MLTLKSNARKGKICITGCGYKCGVSVKPSLLHLASAMSLMRGPIHSVVSEQKDIKSEEKRNGISTLSRRTQAAGVKSTTIVSKSGRSIMNSKSSVTSIASR